MVKELGILTRNFGRGSAPAGEVPRGRSGRGRSETAQATVYQKHRSLQSRKATYESDACPVLEGYADELAQAKP